jgi:hypothetical protein
MMGIHIVSESYHLVGNHHARSSLKCCDLLIGGVSVSDLVNLISLQTFYALTPA